MTPEQLNQRLRTFLRSYFSQNLTRDALRLGNNLKNQVRSRVQTRGENSRGRRFAAYTPQYAKQRQDKGFQIRKVDYTRSGRLWSSITVEAQSVGTGEVEITIGPRDQENAKKLQGRGALNPRKDGVARGLIIEPSQEEIDEVFDIWVEEVEEAFLRSL